MFLQPMPMLLTCSCRSQASAAKAASQNVLYPKLQHLALSAASQALTSLLHVGLRENSQLPRHSTIALTSMIALFAKCLLLMAIACSQRDAITSFMQDVQSSCMVKVVLLLHLALFAVARLSSIKIESV